MPRVNDRRRSRSRFEPVERRVLMTAIWGTAPSLVGLDDVAVDYPDIIGTGQTVAVIDTGIDYTHPSLGGGFGPSFKVIGGYDFADDDADPIDTDGHGTSVAGVIASDEFEVGGFTYRGIAPDAKLLALRIAPNTSDVPLEKIEAALDWVLDHIEVYHIGVVNLSFGFGRFEGLYSDPTLGDELQELRAAGVAFVSSSGNSGTADGIGITAPASDATAFSVGSVSGSDIISEFSQRSPRLSILAVGEGVRTTALGGAFHSVDGTSFAAPAVAGTIALMRQIDPTFTLGDIRSMLSAAMPRNVDGDNEIGVTTGETFLRLDVNRAVGIAQLRKAAPLEQQVNVGNAGNENDLVYDSVGTLHFVYYDNTARTMKYATKSLNGKWSSPTTIDDAIPNVGTEFSLQLDSFGTPHLAYLDSPNGDLKFAKLIGATWMIEQLDTSGVTGLYPSMVIDDNDDIWISYLRKTKFDLRVMHFNGSQWDRQTIDSDGSTGWSTTIELDQNDRPAIAYANATTRQLKLARRDAQGSWLIDVVDSEVQGASYPSLVFDFDNHPRISYYEVDTADLKYASFTGVEWMTQRVASKGATGQYGDLHLNSFGNSVILYWDRRSSAINQAEHDGERWRITRVASNAGKFLSATLSVLTGTWETVSNRDNRLTFIAVL